MSKSRVARMKIEQGQKSPVNTQNDDLQPAELAQPPLPDEELPDDDELIHSDVAKGPVDHSLEQTLESAPSPDVDEWEAIYDKESKSFYFYNRVTGQTTWDNPRSNLSDSRRIINSADGKERTAAQKDYAMHFDSDSQAKQSDFAFQAKFDRRTGRFVADPNRTPENYTPAARADRQMQNFLDTSNIDEKGVSLKAERRAAVLSKSELLLFKQKQKEKKENRRRAWLTKD